MKLTKSVLTIAALMAGATMASAQEAPAPAPATPPAPEASAPAPAAPAGQASFSADEIQKFAKAAVEMQKLNTDTAIAEADKQTRMAEIVKQNGLEAQRFNEIAQAAQSDPAVQQQVQAAAAASATPAAAPTE